MGCWLAFLVVLSSCVAVDGIDMETAPYLPGADAVVRIGAHSATYEVAHDTSELTTVGQTSGGLTTSETGTTATCAIVLSQQPTSSVSVTVTSSNIAEGIVAPSTLTFTMANWATPQTVTITGVDDQIADGPQPYFIGVTVSASDAAFNYSATLLLATNTDDDVANVIVSTHGGLITTKDGGNTAFTVRLGSKPSASVTLALTTSDAPHATISPTSLVFTTANWNTARTVTLSAVVNGLTEAPSAYQAIVGAPSTTDTQYAALPQQKLLVSNFDSLPLSGAWEFDTVASIDYTYDPTKIDFSNGVARLKSTTLVDDRDNSAAGFGGATNLGVAWDSTSNQVRLASSGGCNGTATNCADFDATWTPKYSSIGGYWKLNGTVGALAAGATVGATVGTNGTTSNANASGMQYVTAQRSEGIQFDGSDDYVNVPRFAAIEPTAAISIAAWVKLNAAPGNFQLVRKQLASGSGYDVRWEGTTLKFWMKVNGAWVFLPYTPSPTWVTAQMNHYAFTFDGTTQRIYINGIQVASGTNAGTLSYDAADLQIGSSRPIDTMYNMNGVIDEIAIWSANLTAAEVKAIFQRQSPKYAGSFKSRVFDAGAAATWNALAWSATLPFNKELSDYNGGVQNESSGSYVSLASSTLETGLVGSWHMDETSWSGTTGEVKDDSGQGNHGTAQGGLGVNTNGRFGNSGEFVADTTKVVKVPDADSLDNTSAITISQWFYARTLDGNPRGVVSKRVDSGSQVAYDTFLWTSNKMAVDIDGTGNRFTSNTTFTTNRWYHAVVVYDGSLPAAQRAKLYVDGKIDITATEPSTSIPNYTSYLLIGMLVAQSYAFDGMIDEVSIWNRPLSATEVTQLYRRGGNRLRFQARSCAASDCSDGTFVGPDGTINTYFSELNNNSVSDGSGNVLPGLPALGLSLTSNRYFQYRAVFESDDANSLCTYGACSPELKRVGINTPGFATSIPTVVPKHPIDFNTLATFGETLGAAACPGGIHYALSIDGSTFYYWNGSAWAASSSTYATASTSSVINAHATTFKAQVGFGAVYMKAYFPSDGTQPCELDSVAITGLR